MRWLGFAILLAWAAPAAAHDRWADGSPIPGWVKANCCGPQHVRHLKASEVHTRSDGWHVDGVPMTIPYGRELPSQDGDYWIFYHVDEQEFDFYCFFAPPQPY